jgi:hypothetical protein
MIKMKYHKHIIKKVYEDLGEWDDRLNYIYEIYNEKGEYINNALTLDSAKEYIDSDYDESYL